jgi:hypothetical protein
MFDLIEKILSIFFKILLVLFAIYILRLIFEYFSLNFGLETIFYYSIIGFGLWVIAGWIKD